MHVFSKQQCTYVHLRLHELSDHCFEALSWFSKSYAVPLSHHSPVFDRLAEDVSCSIAQLSSVLLRAEWPRSHQCAVERCHLVKGGFRCVNEFIHHNDPLR